MRIRTILTTASVAAALAFVGLGTAQDGAATAPITEAQIERGAEIYAASCATCHGTKLEGMAHFPALVGEGFRSEWGGERPLAELHTYIHANMPLGQGGSLSDQAYLDVVAFILAANDVSPDGGDVELTAEALEGIRLPAPAGE